MDRTLFVNFKNFTEDVCDFLNRWRGTPEYPDDFIIGFEKTMQIQVTPLQSRQNSNLYYFIVIMAPEVRYTIEAIDNFLQIVAPFLI